MSSKKLNPFKDFQSDQIQRSSRKIFTAHYACRNADVNLTPVTGTTNGFIFLIINSLIESWGIRLTCLDYKFWYTGGRPEQRFQRWLADGLNQMLRFVCGTSCPPTKDYNGRKDEKNDLKHFWIKSHKLPCLSPCGRVVQSTHVETACQRCKTSHWTDQHQSTNEPTTSKTLPWNFLFATTKQAKNLRSR